MKINGFRQCFLVVLILLMGAWPPLYAQQCDSQLKPDDNPTIQYRARQNRCEGFYQRKVAAAGEIAVVGVTDGTFQFALNAKELIAISAPILPKQTVFVRAVGIPPRTYYRLDAQLGPAQTLTWPAADILYPMQLASKFIGIFGWIGTEENKTYVPVRATAKLTTVAQDGKIRLIVRPSVDVRNGQWRSGVMRDGKCASLSVWNKLPNAAYAAGEPIVLILPASATGELYVEVSAQNQQTAEWLTPLAARVLVRK